MIDPVGQVRLGIGRWVDRRRRTDPQRDRTAVTVGPWPRPQPQAEGNEQVKKTEIVAGVAGKVGMTNQTADVTVRCGGSRAPRGRLHGARTFHSSGSEVQEGPDVPVRAGTRELANAWPSARHSAYRSSSASR